MNKEQNTDKNKTLKKIKFEGFQKGTQGELNREAKVILKILQNHYDIEITENPDYLFYNVNSRNHIYCDGIRIFCTIEAICPDFNLADYGIGFEYLEYGDRYFRLPNYFFYPEAIEGMLHRHENVTADMVERKFCSFVYSNDKAAEYRTELFNKLQEYKTVESGGKYCNNLPDGQPVADKVIFEKLHKFSIACENASHPGYHTEKLVEAFAAGTVPIYWGDPLIEKVFNPKAFINCNAYQTIDEVVDKVAYLDQHPEEYMAMLREPALQPFIPINLYEDMYQKFETYLVSIMEQPKEMAYRRNRGFWGLQYVQNKRAEERVIRIYSKLRELPPVKLLRGLRYRLK